MKTPFMGGCVCGAVRYEVLAPPLLMFNCHCRTCQYVTGSAYTPVVVVSSKAFRLTQGELRHHFTESVRGERDPNKRGFCAECGSRITGGETNKRLPWVGITASSLDDPSQFQAQYDI